MGPVLDLPAYPCSAWRSKGRLPTSTSLPFTLLVLLPPWRASAQQPQHRSLLAPGTGTCPRGLRGPIWSRLRLWQQSWSGAETPPNALVRGPSAHVASTTGKDRTK